MKETTVYSRERKESEIDVGIQLAKNELSEGTCRRREESVRPGTRHNFFQYIYIYSERESAREREKEREEDVRAAEGDA